ncbi:Rossmann fold nucleotide-binding protein [Janibacter limosus]|uniref:Rossmann fold nucleotide-binding protein n=1 Tax=Janibacter limosus TaxID=53458 RepID=UPI0035E0642A|nr:Rossmann fold nucleotide-binding protein [Janibacter limosus]
MSDRETRRHPVRDRLGRRSDDPAYREVHDATALRRLTEIGGSLAGWRLQGLDLQPHADHLSRADVRGLVVLGGEVPDALAQSLVARGAVLIPRDPSCPVEPFRARLYSPADLYGGMEAAGYASTVDARAYAWSRETRTLHDAYATLLRAVHDDAVHDALVEALTGRDAVGVMGGHAPRRGSSDYIDAARPGHALAAGGRAVLTGGGPGAMEAANLGALATTRESLESALVRLAEVPSFRPSIDEWAGPALSVRAELAVPEGGARSFGIPTWFYGHEPPNVFCDGIAKYFSNALREDVLPAQSTGGLVVLPGAAGTVQEIFRAATPLYYAPDDLPIPPLVLVGLEHWTETVPVWPALRALGTGRPLGDVLHPVATPQEAAEIVSG